MTNSVHIKGQNINESLDLHTHNKKTGVIAYAEELNLKANENKAFLNEVYGASFNQAAGFSGTPVTINNGGDTAAWTGSAGAGTWNFTDTTNPDTGSQCVSLTAGDNNDNATFAGASSVDGSNYVAITLRVRLETFNSIQNEIQISFSLAGVDQGVTVPLSNYIDSTRLNEYQSAVIPLEDLEIENQIFDEMTFNVVRSGGTKPDFRLDNILIQELGGALDFSVTPDPGGDFFVQQIRITLANNVTGNAALNYNDLLGETLANGILFNRTVGGQTVTGRVFQTVADFYSSGFNQIIFQDDGTNSFLVIEANFQRPLFLGSDDSITIVVQDDLSGLLLATAVARGEISTDDN